MTGDNAAAETAESHELVNKTCKRCVTVAWLCS